MERIVPLLQAVGAGSVDTLENIFINVRDRLPLPKPKPALFEPLNGKVCIVTGGNAGIGYATAKALAQRGAHVVLACRNKERGEAAAEELRRSAAPLPGCLPPTVTCKPLDLASLGSVTSFCAAFAASASPLHMLICNAGLMSPPQRLETGDGLEMQFQVNFLSHWLLAHELVGQQRQRRKKAAQQLQQKRRRWFGAGRRAPDAAGGGAAAAATEGTRIVVVSSLTHHAGSLKWDDKQSLQHYSPFSSYALSKLCNVMMAAEMQRRFDRNDPEYGSDSAVAIHPGIVHTSLATSFFTQTGTSGLQGVPQRLLSGLLGTLFPLVLRTPSSSADSVVAAATAPSAAVAGRYLSNTRLAAANQFALDPERGAQLWDLACELTGVDTHASLR